MSGLDFTRNQKLALIAIIGVGIMALSHAHWRNSSASSGEVVFSEPGSGAGPRVVADGSDPMPRHGADTSGKVIFQVAGCVKCPGVYSLPFGDRVVNAIKSAGGAKPNADLQSINLAAKIQDGSRIYVPSVADTKAGAAQVASAALATGPNQSAKAGGAAAARSSSGDKLRTPGEGVVRINSADETELQRLPGVGPSTAQKILEYRGQIGKFTSAEQLMDVKGIGPKKLEQMRPFVGL